MALAVFAVAQATPVKAQLTTAVFNSHSRGSGELHPDLAAETADYRAAVQYGSSPITVTGTAAGGPTEEIQDASDVTFAGADAVDAAFQVDLAVGDTRCQRRVVAGMSGDTQTCMKTMGRNFATVFEWSPMRDPNESRASGNGRAKGVWSHGSTMRGSDDADDKLYADTLSACARDTVWQIEVVNCRRSSQSSWPMGRPWFEDAH